MKKVILSEKQIKRLMDKLIINEQETENNQQNQGNDSGKYKLYLFDGTTPYAVKNNGNDFQLFKLENGGDGSNKYKITKELSVKPIITMTQNGYIKRQLPEVFRTQNRGGRGVKGAGLNENDIVSIIVNARTHTDILFFSNLGKVYRLRGYQIPEFARTAKGIPVVNLLSLEKPVIRV